MRKQGDSINDGIFSISAYPTLSERKWTVHIKCGDIIFCEKCSGASWFMIELISSALHLNWQDWCFCTNEALLNFFSLLQTILTGSDVSALICIRDLQVYAPLNPYPRVCASNCYWTADAETPCNLVKCPCIVIVQFSFAHCMVWFDRLCWRSQSARQIISRFDNSGRLWSAREFQLFAAHPFRRIIFSLA